MKNEMAFKLRELMSHYKVNSVQVAKIMRRNPQTVRVWRIDGDRGGISIEQYEYLERRLKDGAYRETGGDLRSDS